jgi:general secretion pathway protein D
MAVLQGCTATHTARPGIPEAEKNKDYGAAVAYYTKALQENPDDLDLKIKLTEMKQKASLQHMRNAQDLLAKKFYREAIEELQVSIAYYSSNHRAIELVDKARKMKESQYYARKGLSQIKTGDFADARQSLEQALALNPENEEAARALKKFKQMPANIPRYGLDLKSTAPISLKFKKTPILDVFEILSRLTGVNFIFDKDLRESRVTLFMRDVSFDRFLDVLLQTNTLQAKMINQNSLLIYPDAPAKAKAYNDLYVKTFYLSYLKAPVAIGILTRLLKNDNIVVNEKLNAVTVRGTREAVEMAARVIEANDRSPAEVVLDVEVMEVSRSREKDLGLSISDTITFGKGATDTGDGSTTAFEPLTSLEAISNITRKELFLSLPTATLRLLRIDGDTKVLARPQVRVNSSEKASILIGDRVPLRTNRKVLTDGSTTYDFQYQDVGVKLVVEPVINAYDQVNLKITIEISALGTNVGTVEDPQFSIKTRTVETVLTVYDGDSVIIGGLIEDQDRTSTQVIPMLGEIPILGRLFASKNTEMLETDILLTITPVVIRNQDIPRPDLTGFWTGTDARISLNVPDEAQVKEDLMYKDRPDEDFIWMTRDETFLPGDGYFSIQAYSYEDEATAEKKAEQIEGMDYQTWVIPAQIKDKGTYYRVFVGQYTSYRQAEKALQEMRKSAVFPEDIDIVDRRHVYGE